MEFIIIILILGGVFYYFMQKSPNPNTKDKRTKQQNQNKNKHQEKHKQSKQKGERSGYGKWIGGGLGWAFGGPLGALIGFALGNMFENSSTNQYQQKNRTQSGDFNLSLLALSAAVMKSDGSVKKSELEYVKKFFRQNYSAENTKQMMLVLKNLLQKPIPLQDICLQIQQQMGYHSRLQLIHYLFGIALADQKIHQNEINTIDQIAAYLGIQIGDYNSIKAMFVKDSNSIYKILEISPDASNEEVKKAYKRMAIKYHPDKVSHLGEEVREAAENKFQELQAAYEEIKKCRGML